MARKRQKESPQIWWKLPEPYETGGITKTFIDILASPNQHYCPHCGSNSASLMVEASDLFCITCGWRDSHHFDERLNAMISWINAQEARYGKPTLLSASELSQLRAGGRYRYNHAEQY